MDKTTEIRIRNAANTGWDVYKTVSDIELDKMGLENPKPGYTLEMTIQTGHITGFPLKMVNIINETTRNSSNIIIKTVKTKIAFNSSGEVDRIVEMIDIIGGDKYEILSVISKNASNISVINDTVQVYGTWDTSNPITIIS